MRRPFALPPGIRPAQARDAALAICARARGLDEARELLRCAGLIPDPDVRGGHLGNPACHPLGDRTSQREATVSP